MYSSKKKRLLEVAHKEGALCLDFSLQIYSHRSSASRAIKDLEEEGVLEEVSPPPISQYSKLWLLTDKGESMLQ